MQLQFPLRVITPTLDGDVLAVLGRTRHTYTLSQLHSLIAGRSRQGIRLAVERLVAQGVVLDEQFGRTHAYRLNQDHLAAAPIVELANLLDALVDRMRQMVDQWPVLPMHAAIFGSASTGRMREDSDLDIFLVRGGETTDVWEQQVTELSAGASRWTGNDARVLEFGYDEIVGAADSEPVLADIADRGIWIHGDRQQFIKEVRPR